MTKSYLIFWGEQDGHLWGRMYLKQIMAAAICERAKEAKPGP